MSQATQKIDYSTAVWMSSELAFQLRDLCHEFEIAGSVRRKESKCGDIEIVCVPKFKEVVVEGDLFGKTELRNQVIDWIDASGNDETVSIKGGPKYQKIEYKTVPVDIFMTTAGQFGKDLAVRTGPDTYSKKIAARWVELGYHSNNNILRKDGTGEAAGPFPTEQSFFEFLGWPYIKPEARI